MLFSSKSKKEFVNMLAPDQKIIFNQIKRRRSMIYLMSMLFGAGFSFAVLRGAKLTGLSGVCVAMMVMMGVAYVSYIIWPKGPYMLDYLTGRDQVHAWLVMYRGMMKLYHMGFVLGVVGYCLLVWNQVMANGGGGGGGKGDDDDEDGKGKK